MCLNGRRHSIQCILPPYMLRSLMLNGTKNQRRAANATLAVDQTFRAMRAQLASAVQLEVRRRKVTVAQPSKQITISSAANQEILPGTAVRAQGMPPSGDKAVDEAL
jgi:hypothetical protein